MRQPSSGSSPRVSQFARSHAGPATRGRRLPDGSGWPESLGTATENQARSGSDDALVERPRPSQPRFTFLDDASYRERMASHPSCNLRDHCNPSSSPICWSYILGRRRHSIGSHHWSSTDSRTRSRQARTRESWALRSQVRGRAHHGERRKGDEGRKTERLAPAQVAACVRSRIPWNVLRPGLYSTGASQAMFTQQPRAERRATILCATTALLSVEDAISRSARLTTRRFRVARKPRDGDRESGAESLTVGA